MTDVLWCAAYIDVGRSEPDVCDGEARERALTVGKAVLKVPLCDLHADHVGKDNMADDADSLH